SASHRCLYGGALARVSAPRTPAPPCPAGPHLADLSVYQPASDAPPDPPARTGPPDTLSFALWLSLRQPPLSTVRALSTPSSRYPAASSPRARPTFGRSSASSAKPSGQTAPTSSRCPTKPTR